MATNNRDAAFWRHLANLHESQAANLRKRAAQEDQDSKACVERARLADLAALAPPEPKQLPPARPGAKQGKPTKRG